MSNVESLVIGVISGIITAAVIHLLLVLFDKVLLPWYRQLVYRGVDVQGKWEESLDFGNGNTQITTIELLQKAHAITGSATIVKSTNGEITKTEIMSLKGAIKDRLFNGTIIPVDKKRVGVITALLEIIGDGSKMRGSVSWYDAAAARITANPTEWSRL
ncbi:MAG: hypothetical protein HZA01_14335 [Nitrospinae bacterium]|nr:hypothetical protein [Nitrospinota bacterium]